MRRRQAERLSRESCPTAGASNSPGAYKTEMKGSAQPLSACIAADWLPIVFPPGLIAHFERALCWLLFCLEGQLGIHFKDFLILISFLFCPVAIYSHTGGASLSMSFRGVLQPSKGLV